MHFLSLIGGWFQWDLHLKKVSTIIKHNDGDNDKKNFNEVNRFPAYMKLRLIKQFSMLSEVNSIEIPLSIFCIIKKFTIYVNINLRQWLLEERERMLWK